MEISAHRKTRQREIRAFLGSPSLDTEVVLFLPRFREGARLPLPGGALSEFEYRGDTFSARDTRAAVHVISLFSQVIDSSQIHLRNADAAEGRPDPKLIRILVGSRSNALVMSAAADPAGAGQFGFDFGESWRIRVRTGEVFARPDPSRQDPEEYERSTDYAILARTGRTYFVAGLGSRATEGCGLFLAREWRKLYQRFENRDFAVVLEFRAPAAPDRCVPAAWLPSR